MITEKTTIRTASECNKHLLVILIEDIMKKLTLRKYIKCVN